MREKICILSHRRGIVPPSPTTGANQNIMTTPETRTPGKWQIAKGRLVTQPDPPNGPYVVLAAFVDAEIADRELMASAPAMAREIAAMREALQRIVDTPCDHGPQEFCPRELAKAALSGGAQ